MSLNQKGWDELRSQYEQIHAPRELEERLKSMQEAYGKKKRPNPFLLWGRRTAACLCCAVIGLSIAANASASAAAALQTIPVIGAITKVVTFRHYESAAKGTNANIKTPHITGLGDKAVEKKLNQEFDQYADALISQYESDVKGMENGGGHEAVTSSYKVLVDSDRQLTLEMSTVVARADSMETDWYYNVDKKTGKLLKLGDVFRSGTDYIGPINRYLSGVIQKDPQNYFTDQDKFKTIAKDQNFYIDRDGRLVLVFDEASIAPAYRGVIRFTIPTETVSSLLKPGSLVR